MILSENSFIVGLAIYPSELDKFIFPGIASCLSKLLDIHSRVRIIDKSVKEKHQCYQEDQKTCYYE
jgi:hypothetical protein